MFRRFISVVDKGQVAVIGVKIVTGHGAAVVAEQEETHRGDVILRSNFPQCAVLCLVL